LPEKNIENSCGFQTDRRFDLGIPAEFLRSVPKIPQIGLTGFNEGLRGWKPGFTSGERV